MAAPTSPLSELIIEKIAYMITLGGTIWGILLAIFDYNKRKIAEAKENSVGAEAILLLKKEITLLKEAQVKGEINNEHVERIIERLETDYDMLMKRFFEFFRPSNNQINPP